MDQSDIVFITPGSRRPQGSPDLETIQTIMMKLSISFLNRHLWKGKLTMAVLIDNVSI